MESTLNIVLADTNKPKYRQIAEQLEEYIINGSIPPGSYLPTNRELAIRLSVDRSTIISAYNDKLIFEKCLNNGVLISPSGIYGMPNEGYVKLSFALCPKDSLEKGIRTFCETVLDTLKNRWR